MRIPLVVFAATVLVAACGSISTTAPVGQGDAGSTTDGGAATDAGSGSTGEPVIQG